MLEEPDEIQGQMTQAFGWEIIGGVLQETKR